MTSSFLIKKRLHEGPVWAFGDISSHYIRPTNDCYPGDIAIPIGNSWGAKVCVRPTAQNAYDSASTNAHNKEKLAPYVGLNRGSVNLYDPTLKKPIQQWNPQRYEDRRIPNESLLLQNDYLRWPIKFNATGMETLHAPPSSNDPRSPECRPKPYYSYGFSYMGMDDTANTWAPRSQASSGHRCPTPLYDRTRGHQPWPIYVGEQEYIRDPLSDTYA